MTGVQPAKNEANAKGTPMSVITPEQYADSILNDDVRALLVAEAKNAQGDLTTERIKERRAEIAQAIKAHNPSDEINQRIGKVKSTESVRSYLSKGDKPLSLQAVDNRIRKHNLLRIKTKAGRNAYPAFQFADGGVHENVRSLLHVLLGAGMSDWGVAFWLTEPMDFAGGKRPIDVLNDEGTFEQVLARAKADAGDLKAAH